MRRLSCLMMIMMILTGCSSQTYSHKWNDANPDAMQNGNVPRAVALLKSYTDVDLQNKVLLTNEVQIGKAPWSYYGQAVKFFGQVSDAREFAPGSEEAKLIGGGGLLTVMNPTGTVAVVMIPGGTGQLMRGDLVNVYGFTAGHTGIANQSGMPGQGVLIVGRVLAQAADTQGVGSPKQSTLTPSTATTTPPPVPTVHSSPPATPPKTDLIIQDAFSLVSRYAQGMTALGVSGAPITVKSIVPNRFSGECCELMHSFGDNLKLSGSVGGQTGPVNSVVLTTYAPFVTAEVVLFNSHARVLLVAARPEWKQADQEQVLGALQVSPTQLVMAASELPKGSNHETYQREFELTRKVVQDNGLEFYLFRGTNRYGSPIVSFGITTTASLHPGKDN